jgi:hypothetical protein
MNFGVWRMTVTALAGLLVIGPGTDVRADELSQRTRAHKRATEIATQLVSSIFDVQLRQLDENGLQKTEIYDEIRSARSNVDRLASDEMAELTELLVNAQLLSGEELKQAIRDARVAARRIVIKLMAERKRLRQRLQTARPDDREQIDPRQLAEQAVDLEALGKSLDELVEQQAEATAAAAENPKKAQQIEESIAKSLEKADEQSDVSDVIESRLDQAQDDVAQAQQTLQEKSAAAADRLQAAETAERSLMEAAAEVESQLADIRNAMEAAQASEQMASSESSSDNQPTSGATRDSGSSEVSETSDKVDPRGFADEPWFARLPAAMQAAIQARTRRAAPRGYEERLRRYFQDSD